MDTRGERPKTSIERLRPENTPVLSPMNKFQNIIQVTPMTNSADIFTQGMSQPSFAPGGAVMNLTG